MRSRRLDIFKRLFTDYNLAVLDLFCAYHDYLVRINELNQERSGFFDVGSTDLDRTFCWGWPLPMESFLAQCLQGETVIDSNMIYRFDMQQWEQKYNCHGQHRIFQVNTKQPQQQAKHAKRHRQYKIHKSHTETDRSDSI